MYYKSSPRLYSYSSSLTPPMSRVPSVSLSEHQPGLLSSRPPPLIPSQSINLVSRPALEVFLDQGAPEHLQTSPEGMAALLPQTLSVPMVLRVRRMLWYYTDVYSIVAHRLSGWGLFQMLLGCY